MIRNTFLKYKFYNPTFTRDFEWNILNKVAQQHLMITRKKHEETAAESHYQVMILSLYSVMFLE